MTELTLGSLRTRPCLIECTQHRLWIDTKGHFLCLDRIQERGFLFPPFLFVRLGFLSQSLLFLLFESSTGLSSRLLLFLDRGDLFLDLCGFVFLNPKIPTDKIGREGIIGVDLVQETVIMHLRDYCTHTFFIPKVYRFLDNDSTLAFLSTFFWYPIQNEGVFEEYYLVVLYFGAGARSLLLLGWHF